MPGFSEFPGPNTHRRAMTLSQIRAAVVSNPQGQVCAARGARVPLGLGDPSRIRTCNPRSRNPLLYPVELWDRTWFENRPSRSPDSKTLAFIALPI